MKNNKLVTFSFFISFVLTIIGTLFKIRHWQFGSIILTTGLAVLALFILTAAYEITNSKKTDRNEKIMWIIGLLFFGNITGLIYVLSARKRIV